MTIKIDMHNHSFYSADSSADPEESILRAIEIGLDGIAFTEHDSYAASEPVDGFKEKYKGKIKIFRGAEYNSAEGHVLIFGIRNDGFNRIGPHAPLRDIIRVVNEQDGVVIIPHPFREWSFMRADIETIKGISALEAYNGHNNLDENKRAVREARRLGLPTTGGSDSHHIHEVGSCYTEFFTGVTYSNFLGVLRAGCYRGVSRD
ncbi:MAG: PHP domain-containing protein [Nitrospirae bacterium]|nr:PHP domain-containing protein [Nitrospirota bacterium]